MSPSRLTTVAVTSSACLSLKEIRARSKRPSRLGEKYGDWRVTSWTSGGLVLSSWAAKNAPNVAHTSTAKAMRAVLVTAGSSAPGSPRRGERPGSWRPCRSRPTSMLLDGADRAAVRDDERRQRAGGDVGERGGDPPASARRRTRRPGSGTPGRPRASGRTPRPRGRGCRRSCAPTTRRRRPRRGARRARPRGRARRRRSRAVSRARDRGLEYSATIPSSRSSCASACDCSRPRSFRRVSIRPWKRAAAFSSVSPWRTSRTSFDPAIRMPFGS